jgi:DNA processing protein
VSEATADEPAGPAGFVPAGAGAAGTARPRAGEPWPAMDTESGGLGAEKEAWVVLLAVPGLGPVTFARLLATFGSARAVLAAATGASGAACLSEAISDTAMFDRVVAHPNVVPAKPAGLGGQGDIEPSDAPTCDGRVLVSDLAARIRDQAAVADHMLSPIRSLGLAVVTLDDQEYPERLRRVDMPPPLLFVRGSLAPLAAPSAVAVVGTRTPTDRGRMIAGWVGSALARAGAVVVSGLAVGIDGAAHAAVVAEGLPTVAVLGGGHARLFPRAHERLADAIVAAGGAVVAELAPDTPATRGTFPRRNRIVSGLSDATIVVEAGRRSGALITAGWALEQGRECFLVPGPLDAPTSEGCHLFLRSFPGEARLVCGIPELLEDLDLAGSSGPAESMPCGAAPRREAPGAGAAKAGAAKAGLCRGSGPVSAVAGAGPEAALGTLGPVERAVAVRLTAGPATADDLAACCNLASAAILSALTLLELRGLAVGAYGRYMAAGALARWPGRNRGG